MNKLLYFLFLLIFSNLFTQEMVAQLDLSDAALNLTKQSVVYDPSYYAIDYPNGDVPAAMSTAPILIQMMVKFYQV